MKKFTLTFLILLFTGFVGLGYAQEEVDPCAAFVDDEVDVELCRNYYDLIEQRDGLLKRQQEWNDAAANVRFGVYNAQIAKYQAKLSGLGGGKQNLEAHLQAKIDRLIALRDRYNSTEEGSERDEASKLGPQISALNQLINDIKQELGL